MVTMEELLASQSKKFISLSRNDEVEGTIISKTNREIILDLGTKAEGVLQARELSGEQKEKLKPGDRLKAYVVFPENEYGQTVVSLRLSQGRTQSRFGKGQVRLGKGRQINWVKFTAAQSQKSKLSGKVVEINKGGLIVEVEGVRGFLPNSQVGFEMLKKSSSGMEGLIDQTLTVTVIEVDQDNNKLIFSQRGQVPDEVLERLKSVKSGETASGKIVAVLPFGLVVDVSGMEGLVFISDASWEKIEDLSKIYQAGDEVKVKILGADEQLGRLNLSIKHLSEDPFTKISAKFVPDEVVKGEAVDVSTAGVAVRLEDPSGDTSGTSGVEGFLPASKMGETTYQAGQKASFLVDSVDNQRRKINLAPFVTTTEGLIYK